MAKRNNTPELVTLESLRLAAQENNRNGGSIKKRKSLVMMLNQKTNSLTKQDIRRWRMAWQMALNVENPKRGDLYAIYTDALIDMHLTGCISQRFGKTLLKSFVIKDEDGQENEQLVKIFESRWFYNFLLHSLESTMWGHSLIQLGDIITDANGVMKFSNVELVPRCHVVPEYGVILRDRSDSWEQGISYREGSLSDWCVEVGDNHDLGLLLKCTPHAISKKNMTSYWDVFGEIFGMPMRVGTTTSQNPADRKQIEVMLEEMGAAGWALFPEGTSIEIKESSRGDAYNVYDKRIDRANSEISKGVLAQTMTIDSGSSLSQSETHLEVFENVCASDAKLIKYVVNDLLIPKMIRLGFPLDGCCFDWDDAATYSPAEQRELERMLLQFFDIDPQYFAAKYKVPILGVKQSSGGFFE
nr:MAG TPA: portal [Caudoviricetes sp.]